MATFTERRIDFGEGDFYVDLIKEQEPVGEGTDAFGPYPIYRIVGVKFGNTLGTKYHVLGKYAGELVYEELAEDKMSKISSFSRETSFLDDRVEMSASKQG